MTRAEAIERHAQIAADLGAKARELAIVKSAERKHRIDAFSANAGQSQVRTIDYFAQTASYKFTEQVWQLEAEMRALEEERDHIRWTMALGGFE